MRIEFLAPRLANNQNVREESWDAGCCSPAGPALLPDLHATHLVPSPAFVYSLTPTPDSQAEDDHRFSGPGNWKWSSCSSFGKKTKQTNKTLTKQKTNKETNTKNHLPSWRKLLGRKTWSCWIKKQILDPWCWSSFCLVCLISASLVAQASESILPNV